MFNFIGNIIDFAGNMANTAIDVGIEMVGEYLEEKAMECAGDIVVSVAEKILRV